jgi:hypothetical protein
MRVHILSSVAIGSFALSACASTPGARPSDMSVAQHEQAAGVQEAQATAQASQFSPTTNTTGPDCNPYGGCWTELSNPSRQHLEEAGKHRRMAADHRAAAQTLRDAEAKSCVGVSEYDRDTSPFSHREDITSVQPAYAHVSGKQAGDHLAGASVVFRAVPGMTPEWLQRVVDCHLARNNALGNDVREMSYCPLVPKGVTAKVSSAGDGFAVTIESPDSGTAQEVLRRAQALKNPG